MSLHVLRCPEYENHFFSGLSVCLYVLISVITRTQKQTMAGTPNSVLYICITRR